MGRSPPKLDTGGTNLENFDENAKELRLNTPRSIEAVKKLGVNPTDLLKKTVEDFKGKPHPEKRLKFFEKKRQEILKDCRAARNAIKTSNGNNELYSPTIAIEKKRKEKNEKMYLKRKKALEIQMERTVRYQHKVAAKQEELQVAEQRARDALKLEEKKKRNRQKDERHRKAVEKARREKERKEKWLAQQVKEEDRKLAQLDAKKAKEDQERQARLAQKHQRYDEKTDQLKREKHYKDEMKKIADLRRERKVRDEEEQRRQREEERKLEKELKDEETKERQERQRRKREWENEQKMQRRQKKIDQVEATKRLEQKLKAEAQEREKMLAEALEQDKDRFVAKVREVKGYGLKQVAKQLQVIRLFQKPKSEKGSPRTQKILAAAGSPKSNTGDNGVKFPPLPSEGTFMT
jgi:hypothetical protein